MRIFIGCVLVLAVFWKIFSASLLVAEPQPFLLDPYLENPEKMKAADQATRQRFLSGKPAISREYYQREMAKFFDIKIGSSQMSKLMSGKIGWGNSGKNRPVIKHIRGTGGTPLPSKQKLMEPFQFTPEMKEQMKKTIMASGLMTLEQFDKAPKLKKCPKSDTTVYKFKVTPRDKKPVNKFDLIFIAPEDVPSEPDEAFGKKTIVKAYDPSKPGATTTMATSMGVKCLPTRLRSTEHRFFWHEGLAALKNYDKKPHGRGKLHPLMEHFENEY